MIQLSERIDAALLRVPSMHLQALTALKQNAQKYGPAANPLIEAIDEKLLLIGSAAALAKGRLEFARNMLRIALRSRPGNWLPGRELFQRAQLENSDNHFVVWMQFPEIERRKDGEEQGDRVFFRRRP
jgi:hypothetical protein